MNTLLNPYLASADGPVVAGLESLELVLAKDQPEYRPLRALCSMKPEGRVLTRWAPTAEQRAALADGADIFLELMTFRNPLQPILLSIGEPDAGDILERF
jgi:hypothetical protein